MNQSLEPIETSIIIPVYNKWHLTKNCCQALAKTLPRANVQVIVIDNGSTDETKHDAPLLLQSLFGQNGLYLRNEQNRNFGPASNQGAKVASGQYLLFLNNDTIPLDGWYEPLIQDFSEFANIGATGPKLVYPATELLGHTIQHIGVSFSPSLAVRHIYEGIPAASPLASQRRFFQIITAACLLIPKKTFFEAGLFDEFYKNGLEDISLCAKLVSLGLRQTVNPKSTVIHLASQTPGRHTHEEENNRYFTEHYQHLLKADLLDIWAKDGFLTSLNSWLQFIPKMPIDLDRVVKNRQELPLDKLIELLIAHPIWENGWQTLAAQGYGIEQLGQLFPSAYAALTMYNSAKQKNDLETMQFALTLLKSYAEPWEDYLTGAREYQTFYTQMGATKLAAIYTEWLKNSEMHFETAYQPFMAEYAKLQG